MKTVFRLTGCAIVMLILFSLAFGQEKIRWDFQNPGEVVSATNFESFEVKDGFFSGRTKFDPFLSLAVPKEGIDATKYTFLTIRLFSSTPADVLDVLYNSPNGDWCMGGSFPIRKGWAVYSVDLNKVAWRKAEGSSPEAAIWGGREKKVIGLRLDPGNEADREVKIDWVELTGSEGKEHRVETELSPAEKEALQALTWTFDKDGEFLGWTADNFQKIEVKAGGMKGTTRKFSFLNSPILSLDSEKYPTFVFKAKTNASGHGNVYFKHVGEALADDKCVPFEVMGDNQFHTYRVELSNNKYWKGTIDQIRFDLIYVPDTEFEIASFRFVGKEMGGLIRNGNFEEALAENPQKPENWVINASKGGRLSVQVVPGKGRAAVLQAQVPNANVSLSASVGFDQLGQYRLAFDYKKAQGGAGDVLHATVRFRDILDKPLKDDMEFALASVESSRYNRESTFSKTFQLPEKAAAGDVEISLTSPSGKGEVRLTNAQLFPTDTNAGIMSRPDETSPLTWEAQWIWKPDFDENDKAPAYFRRVFFYPNRLT